MRKAFLLVIVIALSICTNAQGWGDPTPYPEDFDWSSTLSEWAKSWSEKDLPEHDLKIPDEIVNNGGVYEMDKYIITSEVKTKTVGYNILQCEVTYIEAVMRLKSNNELVSRKFILKSTNTLCVDPTVVYSRHSIYESGDNVEIDIRGEAPVNEMGFKRIVSLRKTVRMD